MMTFVKTVQFSDLTDQDYEELACGKIGVLIISGCELVEESCCQEMARLGALRRQHPDNSYLVKIGGEGKVLDGHSQLAWHADRMYFRDMPRFVGLYAKQIYGSTGRTLFSNMQRAYEALPEDIKNQIEGLRPLNKSQNYLDRYFYPYDFSEELQRKLFRRYARAEHKLVQEDAYGKHLVFSEAYTTLDEGIKKVLCEYSYKKDNIYIHEWAQGDFVIANNFKTNHMREPTKDESAVRNIWRVHAG